MFEQLTNDNKENKMKFSALVVALATLADAKKPASFAKNTIQKKLNNVDKRAFLKRARKLEEAEEAENQYYDYDAFQLDSSYSVQFSQCVSYSEDYEGDDDSYADAEAVHVQDYIVVNMVDSYGNVGAVYAMDVGEFVSDMGSLVYEQHSSYCEACEEMNCDANDDAEYENEWNVDYEWNEEDGEYAAVQTSSPMSYGAGYEVVDCDVCITHCGLDNEYQQYDADYEYEGENGCRRRRAEEDIDEEEAFKFIQQIGECQQFKSENQQYSENYNNKNQEDEAYEGELYFGWKCNEEGDGIDLAFFYDGDCSYLDVSGRNGVSNEIHDGSEAYLAIQHMKSLVKGIFTQKVSCEDVTFVTGYEGDDDNAEEEDGEEDGDNYNYDGVSEYCTALIENGLDINDCDDDACAVITAKLGQENENYFEENEDLDEDEQDEMDEDGDIFEFKETYDWAAYDEEGEEQDYCPEEENANVYDYTAWVQRKDDQNGSIFSGMVGPEGISAWAVAGILASVAAIGAVAFVVLKKPTVENESLGEYMLEEPKPVDEKIV